MSSPDILENSIQHSTKKISLGSSNIFTLEASLTKANTPVKAGWSVYIYEKVTGLLFHRTTTDQDGSFVVSGLERKKGYFIVAFDKDRIYNSVTYDLDIKDTINFKENPLAYKPSLVKRETYFATTLAKQIVNTNNLLSSLSCTQGGTDDTGFSWSSTDWSSTSYAYLDGLHCFRFRSTSHYLYSYNRNKSFNAYGEPSTIEFWVNPSAGTVDRAIVGSRVSDGAGHQYIGVSATGKLKFNRPASLGKDVTALSFESQANLPSDKFTHVAIVFTGALLSVYINGVLDTVKEDTYGFSLNVNGIELGYGAFIGFIGGFKVYSSVLYSENFTPTKDLILGISKYEDPLDLYANNILFKLSFPTYSGSSMARDAAKNALLSTNGVVNDFSVTTNTVFETLFQNVNYTFRKRQFTFECVFRLLKVYEGGTTYIVSNTSNSSATLGLDQWAFCAGTKNNPTKFVFVTYQNEYLLNYSFLLNEVVSISIIKDGEDLSFYVNGLFDSKHTVKEVVGNSRDKLAFSNNSSLTIYDIAYYDIKKENSESSQVLDRIPDKAFLTLNYSYNLSQNIENLGFGFTKEDALTSSEEFYSPEHSLVLDGKPLMSLPYTGDSLNPYDYTFAILPTEAESDNVLISLDADDDLVTVSLTADFKLKVKTISEEVVGESSLSTSEFNLVTVTFDKELFKVYLDGTLQLTINKEPSQPSGSSVTIAKNISGFLDDLSFYRNRVVHKENFEKPLPLDPEVFDKTSNISMTGSTKYFIDFSLSNPSGNAFYDSKMNGNWNIYYSWIYHAPDRWLRYNGHGGVYYSPHSFYHNKNSDYSMSVRIRHIVGPHHVNGWTVLFYHPNNYMFYLNRITGAVMMEMSNGGTYLGGVTIGYAPHILSYDEYDFTVSFKDSKVWVHIDKELIGVGNLLDNWTNTYNHWFGLGAPGSGNYPVGYYDLKYFRYELNTSEFPKKNLEFLADKLAFKLNGYSENSSVGKTNSQMLFDNSNNDNVWVNNGSVLAKSIVPLSSITSFSFNGLNQYLSCESIPQLDVGTKPFTFNFQVHLNTSKKHTILHSENGSSIYILEDGSLQIVTDAQYSYTSDYKLEVLKPCRVSLIRKKELLHIYVDSYLRDILLISPYDSFNFSTNSTLVGTDLTNYLNGELAKLAFYVGSTNTPVKLQKEVAPFNYLSNATIGETGVQDFNSKNTWTRTATVTINDSIKKFEKRSATFASSFYQLQSSNDWAIGLSNFTVECTFRLTTMPTGAYAGVFGNWISNSGFCLFIRPGSILDFRINDAVPILTSNSCIKLDTWTTIRIVREGNKFSCYYDGCLIAEGTSSNSLNSIVGPCIGKNGVATDYFNGQIESFKFIKKAVHPVVEDTIVSKPSFEELDFELVEVSSFDISEDSIADSLYPEFPEAGIYAEKYDTSLKLTTSSLIPQKVFLRKKRSLFEAISIKTTLSANPLGVVLEEGVEIVFRSTGVTIIKNGEEIYLGFSEELTNPTSIEILKKVSMCEIVINDLVFDKRELFSNVKPENDLNLTFAATSNILTSIALTTFTVKDLYSKEVYLYSPLKNSTDEFINRSVQETSPAIFVNSMLQVKSQALQFNSKPLTTEQQTNCTLVFDILLKKFGQTILVTDLYTVRITLTGLVELLVDNIVVVTSTTPLSLDRLYTLSIEKYQTFYKLFIDTIANGSSEPVLKVSSFDKIIIGSNSSDYLITDLLFMSGSTQYEKILEREAGNNDYNAQPLFVELNTSSYLSFEESTTKDATGRVWTAVGSSPAVVNNQSPVGKALYMNGIDDYIMTNAGAITGGATPFVVEFLVCPDSIQPPNGNSNGGNTQTGTGVLFAQNYNTGSGEQFFSWSRSTGIVSYSTGSVRGAGHLNGLKSVNSVPKNHWTKVALSYDGKTMRIFLNGRLEASSSYATGWMNNGSRIRLGHCLVEGYSDYRVSFAGHFDEFRITDGSCHMFKDHSRYEKDLVSYLSFDDVVGSTSVLDNKGISWSSSNLAYNTSTVYKTSYSSASFNGTSTKVTTTDSIFNFGKEDFSFKFRFYPTDPSVYTVLFSNNSPDTANLLAFTVANSSSTTIPNCLYFYHKGSNLTSRKAVVYNAWNEGIIQRQGTSLKILLNGDLTEGSIDKDFVCNFSYGGGSTIGMPSYTTNSNFKGYLDSMAVYKTAIIPTSKTPVLNLPLEYNVFDLDNYDTDWAYKDIEFKKINGKPCCYFNGSTSYLTSSNARLNLGAEDFIINFEVCASSLTNTYGRIIATKKGTETSAKQYIMLTGSGYPTSTLKQSFYFGQQDNAQNIFSTGFTATLMQWYSVEIVRKAGTVTFYVDGVAYNTALMNNVINFMENGAVYIGGAPDASNVSQFFNGYLRNFKIYKGTSKLL